MMSKCLLHGRPEGDVSGAALCLWSGVVAFVDKFPMFLVGEPAKTPQYSKRPRKSKNSIRKKTKEDVADLLVPRGDVEKSERLALPCQTCGRHHDDLAGHHA